MKCIPASWRYAIAAICLVLVSVVGPVIPASAQDGNPGVLPPPSRPHGSTYAEWSARWWQWALSIPADRNPLNDGSDCLHVAAGQSGQVWFLGGAIDVSTKAERDCSVPAGKALFFPLINVECSTLEAPPFFGSNEDELRACADGFAFADVFAEIDGVAVSDLDSYLVQSPRFNFTLPPDNVLGIAPGAGSSVSDGHYLMLAPLSPGKHVVRFGGTYPDFDFSIAMTYNLTVGK